MLLNRMVFVFLFYFPSESRLSKPRREGCWLWQPALEAGSNDELFSCILSKHLDSTVLHQGVSQ